MSPLRPRNALLLLVLAHFTTDLYGSFLAPLQPFLAGKLGLSLAQAGLLVSLYSLSASLLQPVYGFLSDRLRNRVFVMIGPLVAAIFMSLLPAASSFAVLLVTLFIAGVGVASFHPQASSISHAVSGSRKGLGVSLFISGGNFGTAAGPLFIMLVVRIFGLDSTYLAAIPGILFCLLFYFLCPSMEYSASKMNLSALTREIRQVASPLSSLYFIVVLRTVVQLSFLTYVPIYLKQQGFSALNIGLAVTCYTGLGAIGGVIGGFLYDRIGGRSLFLISNVVSPLFLFLTFQVEHPVARILFFALSGFSLMMTIPISVLMGQSIAGAHAISTVSSLMMGFGWGLGGMMVPLTGKLADATSIPHALSLLAFLPLACLVLAWRLPRITIRKTEMAVEVLA